MKIQKLEIKNLRSFDDKGITIENLGGLNLFVGKNNSGKSNAGIALDTIFHGLLINDGRIPIDGASNKVDDTFWFNKLTNIEEKPVSIQLLMDSVLYDKDIKDMLKGVQDDSNKKSFIQENHGSILSIEINISLSPNLDRTIVSLKKALLANTIIYRQDSGGFHSFNFTGYVEEHSQNKPDRSLEIMRNFLKDKFCMIKSNRIADSKIAEEFESMEKNLILKKRPIFEKVNNYMKLLFPSLKDSIMTYNYIRGKELHIDDNLHLPISSYGEGVAQIFTILFYIFRENADMIFIEEPEAYLHPTLLKRFVDLLEKIAKEESKQFFLVTHSAVPLTVDKINNTFRFALDKEKGTKVYNLRKDIINVDRLKQELNPDNCEMFFADQVILVEGLEDKLFIQGLIEISYSGKKEIKIINVGGKENFEIYKDVLTHFGIPYSIICDSNCLDNDNRDKSIAIIKKQLENINSNDRDKLIKHLKEKGIFVLSENDISDYYPQRISNIGSGAKRALKVLAQLNEEDRIVDTKFIKLQQTIAEALRSPF